MVKVTGDKPNTLPAEPATETPSAPEAAVITTPPDPSVAVDSAGRAISVGDYVDVYYCKVVGFRNDPNNRFNVWVVPSLNTIITNNPSNPLEGLIDGKAILVSGYNCNSYAGALTGDVPDSFSAPAEIVTAIKTAVQKAKDTAGQPVDLPSNFLAPSII